MVHHNHSNGSRIGIAVLAGVMLLLICVSGAMAADPAVTITVTKWNIPPLAPTDFEIQQTGIDSANITWTMGKSANITIIRVSTNGYPFSPLDGDAVYSGNATYVEVNGLDLTTYVYYYRAWSQNEYGTSTDYAQATIGSGGMAGADMSELIDYLEELIGGPMGIVNMFFVMALVGFGFWKKGWLRVLLATGVIIWGVFFMEYDIKVAAPLMAIGSFLFFTGIMNLITRYRASRDEA